MQECERGVRRLRRARAAGRAVPVAGPGAVRVPCGARGAVGSTGLERGRGRASQLAWGPSWAHMHGTYVNTFFQQ